MHRSYQVKGEKLPEVPVEIRKGIKEYRKKVTKQVWPVIEKVSKSSVTGNVICRITVLSFIF